jgi:hypothetical protein
MKDSAYVEELRRYRSIVPPQNNENNDMKGTKALPILID